MANEFYDHTTYPSTGASGSSSAMRSELNAIEVGFDKLPTMTGNGSEVVKVNAGGTALETQAADALVAATIHAATSKTTPVDADEVGIVDSAASNGLKKLTFANLGAWVWSKLGALISGGTDKATPVDADTLALSDSAAANATKKLTWANVKTTLGSTFAALSGLASQVFSVAAATAAAHAVRADQIQTGSVVAFTTGGTGTAFTLTPAPALAAYTVNSQFSILFNAACGLNPTINISGLGATVNLVKQLADGAYAQLDSDDFPSGWISECKLVSATEMLVSRLPRRLVTGVLSRDLTAATGTVSVTGLNFRPRVVRLTTNIGGTNILTIGRYMNGNTGGGVNSCIYQHSAAGFYGSPTKSIIAGQDGSNYQDVTITPTADGFDMVWAKTASPTGTLNIHYEAEE